MLQCSITVSLRQVSRSKNFKVPSPFFAGQKQPNGVYSAHVALPSARTGLPSASCQVACDRRKGII
jgi:hypothetical protein